MVISTHLPPPVIMESTAIRECVTHMLCWSWAMYFSAADSSENDHGSMNFDSKTAPVSSTTPSRVAAIQTIEAWYLRHWRCPTRRPDVFFKPEAVQALGHETELNDEIVGQIR